MQDTSEISACPYCGAAINDLSPHQIALLRAAMMADIVPALLHDAGYTLDSSLSMLDVMRHNLAKLTPERRFREALDRAAEDLKRLHQFFRNLRDLFRAAEDALVVPLSDLPRQIAWMWRLFGLRHEPNVAALRESEARIKFASYWDSFTFAVHAALISLRQDRQPNLAIFFSVDDRVFATRIEMHHREQPDTTTPQWQAFRSAVKHSEGTATIAHAGGTTNVEWVVPLVKGVE
jgi:hypothetical protein